MADFHRLTWRWLLVQLLAFCVVLPGFMPVGAEAGTILMSPANVPAKTTFYNGYQGRFGNSAQEACNYLTAGAGTGGKYTFGCYSGTSLVQGGIQQWYCSVDGNGHPITIGNRTDDNAPSCGTQNVCDDPSAIQDVNAPGTCNCPTGQVDDGTHKHCISVCQSLNGQAPNLLTCTGISCGFFTSGDENHPPLGANSVCDSVTHCSITGNRDVSWYDPSLVAWGTWLSNTKYDGNTCDPANMPAAGPVSSMPTGTATTTTTPTITPDHAGKCPGQVNGVDVWVTCGTISDGKPTPVSTTTTTTLPDGSTATQAVTGSTQTSCTNGQCTTTGTTTVTVTGSSGTTSTTTGSTTVTDQEAFCKANPTAAVCGGVGAGLGGGGGGTQSTWGGSCMAGFDCSGDAALCAAAKGVWQQKCALIDGPATPTPEQQAYAAAVASSGAGLGTSTVSVSSSSFDSSNSLGAGATCPGDLTVTVWGTTQVIAISQVCPWLSTLGTIMLALAWLSAAVIVGKGVTG